MLCLYIERSFPAQLTDDRLWRSVPITTDGQLWRSVPITTNSPQWISLPKSKGDIDWQLFWTSTVHISSTFRPWGAEVLTQFRQQPISGWPQRIALPPAKGQLVFGKVVPAELVKCVQDRLLGKNVWYLNLKVSDERDIEVRNKASNIVVHLGADRHGVGEHQT